MHSTSPVYAHLVHKNSRRCEPLSGVAIPSVACPRREIVSFLGSFAMTVLGKQL